MSKIGTKTDEIIDLESRFVLGTYPRFPFVLERGRGMHLYDTEGNAYLDFGSGIAVNALGHADPEIVAACQQQIATLSHISNLYHSAPQAQLAQQLCQHSFADKVFFSNSGAEAIEAALKFARKYGRSRHGEHKTGMVAFSNGFHGRTFGALSITARQKYQAPFKPLLSGVTVAAFNDVAEAEQAIGSDTCAVIVEPLQGEGGLHVATPEFLQSLRQLCDQHDALLIFDEIQCGMGRTGKLWTYQHFNVQPDVMALAKALGGGLPIGATLLTDTVAEIIQPGEHGSTFGGGPVVCQSAMVVLERVSSPEMLAHVESMGAYLQSELKAIKSDAIKQVRGLGLMIGLELYIEAKPVIEQAYQNGVLLLSAGENVIRIVPPLIVCQADIDQMVAVLKEILN